MKYSEPAGADRADLASALGSGDASAIVDALLGLVDTDPDWPWVQDTCLELISHAAPDVRAAAVTSLGHLARLHGQIDRSRVLPPLGALLDDPALAGRAEDALDDINTFAR